jgi:hypothetical protein
MILVYSKDREFANMVDAATSQNTQWIYDSDYLYDNVKDAHLLIFDGSAKKNGSMSTLKELELQLNIDIPSIMIVDRKEDVWIADWAKSSIVLVKPINPFTLSDTIKKLS